MIIDLSYDLNKYTQYEHVWKPFEVGCLHQHTKSPCIAYIGKKTCSKFLHNLVTTVHVIDQNWNSKTVYRHASNEKNNTQSRNKDIYPNNNNIRLMTVAKDYVYKLTLYLWSTSQEIY